MARTLLRRLSKLLCCFKGIELMNLETSPKSDSIRSDIVQAVKFKDEKSLVGSVRCLSVSPMERVAIPDPRICRI